LLCATTNPREIQAPWTIPFKLMFFILPGLSALLPS
jgi:hypothetical protein